jgi:sigma54-dependent transcription regulator
LLPFFAASRARRATSNDADRLRKYLARFNLSWQQLQPWHVNDIAPRY